MNKIWKVVNVEDGREILYASHKVDSLEIANDILQKLLPIIVKHNA